MRSVWSAAGTWRALTLAYDDARVAELSTAAHRLRAAGMRAEVLGARAVREAEPGLGVDTLAALKTDDAMVNPFLLTRFGLRELLERGGRILRTQLREVSAGADSIEWIETEHARIVVPAVVNAAGTGSPQVAAMFGTDLPVSGSKGQQLIALAPAGLLASLVNGHGHLGQPIPGHYIVGATREPPIDDEVTLQGAAGLAADAVKTIPALAGAAVIRAFAGVRPVPIDGLPILGPDPRRPGYVTAVLHGGMTLALLVGELIACYIAEGDAPFLGHYGVSRFNQGASR